MVIYLLNFIIIFLFDLKYTLLFKSIRSSLEICSNKCIFYSALNCKDIYYDPFQINAVIIYSFILST